MFAVNLQALNTNNNHIFFNDTNIEEFSNEEACKPCIIILTYRTQEYLEKLFRIITFSIM